MVKRPKQAFHQRKHINGKKAHENCSASLAIQEIQNKKISLFTYSKDRIKNLTILGCDKDRENLEMSFSASNMLHFGKEFKSVL